VRLAGYGVRRPRTRVRGREVAGRVEAVGRGVTTLRVGDELFGIGEGSFAEYVCARADRLAPTPKNLTFEQAAALPVSALTALQALRDHGKARSGQKVLVIGASGGVGTFAVQIAKALGADVTAVCSTRNVDIARSLGADHVIDYTQENFTQSGTRFDAILDLAGSRPLSDCVKLLVPTGAYVSSVGRLGWVLKVAVASLSARGRGKIVLLTAHQTQQDLAVLKEMLESGKIKPAIDRLYTLAEVPEALQYLGQGHAQGRIVVTV
jgi:NADPH:quinone reductase-like Zn-dependent oxidoreductase